MFWCLLRAHINIAMNKCVFWCCDVCFCVFVSPRWALWFYKNDKSKMWQDNLRLITTFDTVEDFWGWVCGGSTSETSSSAESSLFRKTCWYSEVCVVTGHWDELIGEEFIWGLVAMRLNDMSFASNLLIVTQIWSTFTAVLMQVLTNWRREFWTPTAWHMDLKITLAVDILTRLWII